MWGRQSYRLSPQDFEANAKMATVRDWPIRYDDLAPWYSHVEKFIGVAGSKEGLPQLPDGEFLPEFGLNDGELMFKAAVEEGVPGPQGDPRAHRQPVEGAAASRGTGPLQLPGALDLRARLLLRRLSFEPQSRRCRRPSAPAI